MTDSPSTPATLTRLPSCRASATRSLGHFSQMRAVLEPGHLLGRVAHRQRHDRRPGASACLGSENSRGRKPTESSSALSWAASSTRGPGGRDRRSGSRRPRRQLRPSPASSHSRTTRWVESTARKCSSRLGKVTTLLRRDDACAVRGRPRRPRRGRRDPAARGRRPWRLPARFADVSSSASAMTVEPAPESAAPSAPASRAAFDSSGSCGKWATRYGSCSRSSLIAARAGRAGSPTRARRRSSPSRPTLCAASACVTVAGSASRISAVRSAHVGDEQRREERRRAGRSARRRPRTADDDEAARAAPPRRCRDGPRCRDASASRRPSAELLAGQRLGREQPGDARGGRRAEAASERDLVVHLDAHHRRLEAELLQAVLEADQESVARVEADLVLALAFDDELTRRRRRAA